MPIPRPIRGRAVECALVVLAFAFALAQRPGLTLTDTKVDLHVDPVRFLGDVLSAWSSTGDVGHVQGGQYGGYAFPMAPFFALGHELGVAPWLVQRLWFGLLLAVAACGAARLVEALVGGARARAVAGTLYLLNPYVVLFANRTTVTLLAYAVLPWLLLVTRRGLREPTRWRAPAAFALLVTASGGGVNAAVTAWALLGPLLLAGYEAWIGAVKPRAIWSLGIRTFAVTALASAWWVAPLLIQSRYGVDFLAFTEQPGTIWATTSLPESLRLMGYWVSYLGVGYSGTLQPYFGDSGVMLFSSPVVLAQLLVPALALASLVWTRRRGYAPFALGLALTGLLVMFAGFPDGTPLRRALHFTYNHVEAVQFLRTTHKAGPLLALALALLGGMAAAQVRRRRLAPFALAGAALVALSVWPLVRGQATESRLSYERVPPAWEAAARQVDAAGGRAVVLPGQLYANYDWGGTVDALLPALARTPVAARFAVPYADLRATDLLWTLDGLVQQRRALPGQLGPLLDLIGARTVVAGSDDVRALSGAATAADAADVLDQLGPPQHAWGAPEAREPAAGTLGTPRELPRVRAWDRRGAAPLVRVEPERPATVIDGGADALAALAAFGALPAGGFVFAPDAGADTIRDANEVVIADGNRRRVLVVSRLVQNAGATLAAGDPISEDAAVLDPFGSTDAQTVARLEGVAYARAPFSPGFPQFPEHRPFAALDGDRATYWLADRALEPDRHWLEVGFEAPRDVPYVDLEPYSDRLCTVLAVEIAGRRFEVEPGANRLQVDLRDVRSLRATIAATRRAPEQTKHCGGIRELAIPGVTVRDALRPPVVAERALTGADLPRTSLTYLFQRTTGDDPFRRDPWRGAGTAALVRDRGDGEPGLKRVFTPPAAREWQADGWVTVAADAPDDALDRLVGVGGRFTSSARFQGRAGWRASSAFDGTAQPWIGSWQHSRTPWLEWTLAHAATIQRFTLQPVPRVRLPRQVRVNGVAAPVVDGTVTLPRPVRASTFRLEVVDAAFAPGTSGQDRQARAVGIAELSGAGLPSVHVPRSGPLAGACDDLAGTLAGRPLGLRVDGDIADLDAGRPLRARGCAPVTLPAGETWLSLPAGVFAPYLVRLRSAATAPGPAVEAGRVADPGEPGRGEHAGVRLDLRRGATLVYAAAYNAGWQATCDGRDLGAPRPVDGFAMGWTVPPACRAVELAFAPDRLMAATGIVSLATVLALLVIVLRRRGVPVADVPPPLERTAGRWPVPRAAVAALLLSPALGFVFAARATPWFALGLFVILWRGISARALLATAGALLVVAVPLLTLAIPVPDRGGYNPDYAGERVAVHWVAVAAVALLIVALARLLSERRRGGRSPA